MCDRVVPYAIVKLLVERVCDRACSGGSDNIAAKKDTTYKITIETLNDRARDRISYETKL